MLRPRRDIGCAVVIQDRTKQLAISDKIERATVTIEEAAKILGIGRASAYSLAQAGVLPTLKLGVKRLVVPRLALDRMLEDCARDRSGSKLK